MEASLSKQAGSTVSKNSKDVKSILDKHKIPYGNGNKIEVLKAVFGAIKGGNTDVATDMASLIVVDKNSKSKGLFQSGGSKMKLKDIIKQGIDNSRSIVKNAISNLKNKNTSSIPVSNADGDPVSDTALALINDINTNPDSDKDASEGFSDTENAVMKSIFVVVVIMIIIGLVLFASNKYMKK